MMNTRFGHRVVGLRCMLVLAILATMLPAVTPRAAAQSSALVNLAHLEFLHDTIPYPDTPPPGHTTVDPGVPLDGWWTYADYRSETGIYQRVGGGAYDAATNTWSQGAYNLDDVARIALVYLLHYRTFGDQLSRDRAYGALRHVLYLQTLEGEDRGNFVLWMQPNGDLNPSPTPVEFPDPSDSDFSWWAVRAMWAISEGYAVFKAEEPAFAAVLRERQTLAMDALKRQVIDGKYGTYKDLHGYRVPNWFVREGADASSDAVVALTRFHEETGDPLAAQLATQLAEALDQFQVGDATSWAFRAHLPYAGSLTLWHAWGGRQMQALSQAGRTFNQPDWITSAQEEANTFIPHQWISTGPINGLLPAPNDLVQINYGNETIVNNLLATARATDNQVYSQLAGLQASWWFGNNPAGQPMYDPATGRGYDGIEPDGRINRNSGAESVLSALYGVLNVLQDPVALRYMQHSTIVDQLTWQKIDAETGTLAGDAEVVQPASAWTGEALWSGGKYVRLGPNGELTLQVNVPRTGRYRLFIVYDKQPGEVAAEVRMPEQRAQVHQQGGAAPPGDSPNESYLWMDSVFFPRYLDAGMQPLVIKGLRGNARIDAVLLQPAVEYRTVADRSGQRVTLAKSFDSRPALTTLRVGSASACVKLVTPDGQVAGQRTRQAVQGSVSIRVPAYGYAFVEDRACQSKPFKAYLPLVRHQE